MADGRLSPVYVASAPRGPRAFAAPGGCRFDSLAKPKLQGLKDTVDEIQQESDGDSRADRSDYAENRPEPLGRTGDGQGGQAYEHEINHSGACHDASSGSLSTAQTITCMSADSQEPCQPEEDVVRLADYAEPLNEGRLRPLRCRACGGPFRPGRLASQPGWRALRGNRGRRQRRRPFRCPCGLRQAARIFAGPGR